MEYVYRSFFMIFVFGLVCAKAPVQIERNPSNMTVIEGRNVILESVVSHVPGDERHPVFWVQNGFVFELGRERKFWDKYSYVGDVSLGQYYFLIENATLEDDAWYEIQVPKYDLRSKPAKLTVQVPPKGPFIEGKKEDGFTLVEVVRGKPVELKCDALRGKPAATLQWYRNGSLMSDVNVTTTALNDKTFNTRATLRLQVNEEVLHSKYSCAMSNAAMEEKIEAELVQFKVVVPPKVSISVPSFLKEGESAVVKCLLNEGPTAQSYRWYLNDTLQSGTKATFKLGPITRSWNGVPISCEARNEAGFSKAAKINLNVMYAPIFLDGNTDHVAEINDNVTFRCHWDSNPKPIIKWTREGSDKVLANGPTLEIHEAQLSDSGTYTCHSITQKVGSSLQYYKLSVNGPPTIKSPDSQEVVVGNTATLLCSIGGSPGIEDVTWTWIDNKRGSLSLHNDEKLRLSHVVKYEGEFDSGSSVARLKIYDLNVDEVHDYNCKVSNSYGFKSSKIKLFEDKTTGPKTLTGLNPLYIIIIVISIVVVVFIVIIMAYYLRRRRRKNLVDKNVAMDECNAEKGNNEQNENLLNSETGFVTSRPGSSNSSKTHDSLETGYNTEDAHIRDQNLKDRDYLQHHRHFVDIDGSACQKPLMVNHDTQACGDSNYSSRLYVEPLSTISPLTYATSSKSSTPVSNVGYPFLSNPTIQYPGAPDMHTAKESDAPHDNPRYFRLQGDSSHSSLEKDPFYFSSGRPPRMYDANDNTGRNSELSHVSYSSQSSAPSQQYISKQATRV